MPTNAQTIALRLLRIGPAIFVCERIHLPGAKILMTEHKHPCHSDQLVRLKRVEGQIRGVARMIEEQKYCVDILNQIKATTKALEAVERAILKTHLRACIKDTLSNTTDFEIKLEELMTTLKR